ncbi:TfoX/Sxy family protein [Aeromicrobium duanguangcaii]|uniref:TfoX/Sxy family protein n=1 Tax=Aeromicrobium duanguangcaii TaxID=2968086 RepID=A0ABY5KGD7_9ACTN|nr:TfoX/Sxy family protein [Aeromicrobium duanguangcaii]MCD9153381.1 TfoX/Sxy family protein [Aeromicrobium duanguangcaii]MCL3836633.1 TfoX/Sxy family protein [Aeromicrobium duanguangcaii]UUI69527.1 TfoX/Sxy family protein [Aeromicrobium duanguangcaii]
MSPQEMLVRRIRRALADRRTREVSMFGGLSFMVDGALAVSAGSDGDLLVRIDPTRRDELAARPGAKPAVMKNGREMGERWLQVDPVGLAGEDDLAFWVGVGVAARPD